jgi:hypothetical protein
LYSLMSFPFFSTTFLDEHELFLGSIEGGVTLISFPSLKSSNLTSTALHPTNCGILSRSFEEKFVDNYYKISSRCSSFFSSLYSSLSSSHNNALFNFHLRERDIIKLNHSSNTQKCNTFSNTFLSYIKLARMFPFSSSKVSTNLDLNRLVCDSFPSSSYEDTPFMVCFQQMIKNSGTLPFSCE